MACTLFREFSIENFCCAVGACCGFVAGGGGFGAALPGVGLTAFLGFGAVWKTGVAVMPFTRRTGIVLWSSIKFKYPSAVSGYSFRRHSERSGAHCRSNFVFTPTRTRLKIRF